MTNNNKLLWFGITCMVAAALVFIIDHASAQQPFVITNQTKPANDTIGLLKQIIANQKLQIQFQELNANVIATKLDTVKAELQQIKTALSTPLVLPPPGARPCGTDPSLCNLPPLSPGCGFSTDNSLCNVPVPPFLSPPPFNATACKQQNDAGVLIYCPTPTFPSGLLPAIPTPPPFLAAPDCIYTANGVFFPTN
jgi:hypothetical protein